MFNIKKKIYAIHNSEFVDLMYERSIIAHPRYKGVSVPTYAGIEDDITMPGVVFVETSLDEMIENRFDNDWEKFYDFLLKEEDLQIIVSEHDYVRLYKMVQLELQKTYGISDENLLKMRDLQILKDYTTGPLPTTTFCATGSFEQVFQATSFTPTGKLYGNISELPFEVAYVMYKWGNISEAQVNVKVAALAEGLLEGQIRSLMDNARTLLGSSPAWLQAYLDDDTIDSVSKVMAEIDANELLKSLMRHESVDLSDSQIIAEVKKVCYAVIENELDFDSQPEVDKEELDFFFDLNETKSVETLDKARYNFIATGMVSTKAEKFNSMLMMV